MEDEIRKQTPLLHSMFSNPPPPRVKVRADIKLHGDFELPSNCRNCVFTVTAIGVIPLFSSTYPLSLLQPILPDPVHSVNWYCSTAVCYACKTTIFLYITQIGSVTCVTQTCSVPCFRAFAGIAFMQNGLFGIWGSLCIWSWCLI